MASLYLERKHLSTVSFYRKDLKTRDFSHVNAIFLYALTPDSGSSIKDLALCTSRCPGDEKIVFSYALRTEGLSVLFMALIVGLLIVI